MYKIIKDINIKDQKQLYIPMFGQLVKRFNHGYFDEPLGTKWEKEKTSYHMIKEFIKGQVLLFDNLRQT